MTIIRDKTHSQYQFKTFTRIELRAKLVEILGTSIISKVGEKDLSCEDVIFTGKGSFDMTVYQIIGFGPSEVWQKINTNGSRSDFGQHSETDLTVICEKIACKDNRPDESLFIAIPSETMSNLKKTNKGFRKLGG